MRWVALMTNLQRHVAEVAALLNRPDPPDLPPRGHRVTCERDPRRDPWELKRLLGVAYIEHVRQAWVNGDISSVVATHRYARLRVVRSA